MSLGYILTIWRVGCGAFFCSLWFLLFLFNGDRQFWNEKIHAANGMAHHAPLMDPLFPLLWVGSGEFSFFCFFKFVPNVFPTCSHQVPNFFPKAFPIALQFYPIWFCSKFNFHVYKLKGRLYGNTIVFILQLGSKEVFLLGSAQCFFKIANGPMNMALSKMKIKIINAPMNQLIWITNKYLIYNGHVE